MFKYGRPYLEASNAEIVESILDLTKPWIYEMVEELAWRTDHEMELYRWTDLDENVVFAWAEELKEKED